ncbi:hypothetical protein Tco_0624487 [Tanacetum coccineum]|uniref:Uncharacterized protein n=1 Tax=Tanacetum coccineum TaxID=301880 RepID=A0ABQ4WE36_9ASTR
MEWILSDPVDTPMVDPIETGTRIHGDSSLNQNSIQEEWLAPLCTYSQQRHVTTAYADADHEGCQRFKKKVRKEVLKFLGDSLLAGDQRRKKHGNIQPPRLNTSPHSRAKQIEYAPFQSESKWKIDVVETLLRGNEFSACKTSHQSITKENAFTASANVPAIYLQQFWNTMKYNEKTGVYSCQVDEQWFDLSVDLLRKALAITPVILAHPFELPPSDDQEKSKLTRSSDATIPDQVIRQYRQTPPVIAPSQIFNREILCVAGQCLLMNQESEKSSESDYQKPKRIKEALIADEIDMDKGDCRQGLRHKRKHDSDDDERTMMMIEALQLGFKLALTTTGWQINDTRDTGADSSMHRSDPESEHSEQSSDDIPMQDEGNDSDMEDYCQCFNSKGKKKLCKADLEGPAFNLVKAFHKNNVFLQYQMDECHKLLTNKVDLSNPEGWKEFYINKHSESSDREAVRSQMRILSVISVKVFKKYGYTYLREIILCRADYQEYKISEKDFRNLHPNDFEDLFLLNIQEKLNHLPKTDKTSRTPAVAVSSSLRLLNQNAYESRARASSINLLDTYERPHKGVKASANSDIMYFFTSAQDGDPLQDDVRLCLDDDLKKLKITVKGTIDPSKGTLIPRVQLAAVDEVEAKRCGYLALNFYSRILVKV